jgi:hypothetical protein
MSYRTQYVTLPGDKAAHIIGDGQRTACGEPLPYGSAWTTEPDGKVCADCTARVEKDAKAAEGTVAEVPVNPALPLPEPEPEPESEPAPKKKAKDGDEA